MDKNKNYEMIDDKDLEQVNGGVTPPMCGFDATASVDGSQKKRVKKGQGGKAANAEQC